METVEPAARVETQAEEDEMIEDYDVQEPERIKVTRSEGPWVIEEPLERDQPEAQVTPDPQATQAFDPFAGEEEADVEVVEPESTLGREPAAGRDWLEEAGGDVTMNFPARSSHLDDLARSPLDREEVKARVQYLFPRTETNWAVGSKSPRRAAS